MSTAPSDSAIAAPAAASAPRGGRRMLSWLFGLIALAALVGSIWYAYDRGLKRSTGGPPPLIKADPGPTRMKPEDPGGLKVPYQSETIYREVGPKADRGRDNPGAERLLPPPEQPLPKPKAPEPAVVSVPMPPPPATVAAEPPVTAAPLPPPPSAPPAASSPPPVLPPVGEPVPLVPPAAPTVAASPPAAPPAPAPRTPRPAPSMASPGADGVRIQLGALADAAAAAKAWSRYKAANADVLGNASPSIIPFTPEGKATVYRLQAGPFADLASAKQACETLKSRRLDCLVRP